MDLFSTSLDSFSKKDQLIECIPNISEGKDKSKINKIVSSISNMDGIKVLNVDSSISANRTVVTFIGEKTKINEASTRFILSTLEHIDMREHQGVHPRLGACDVFPIVPYKNTCIYDAITLSKNIARNVYTKVDLPIYFYEYSSFHHTPLQDIRRGEYELLEKKLNSNPPDIGQKFNPKTGALVIGARFPLIAYNINMAKSCTLSTAKLIASIIRESGNKNQLGWLKKLKAIGWYLEDIDKIQISCNLTNYKQTPLFLVYELVKSLSVDLNTFTTGSQIIGLVPFEAMLDCYRYYTKDYKNKDPNSILEKTSLILGLSDIDPFDIYQKVLP